MSRRVARLRKRSAKQWESRCAAPVSVTPVRRVVTRPPPEVWNRKRLPTAAAKSALVSALRPRKAHVDSGRSAPSATAPPPASQGRPPESATIVPTVSVGPEEGGRPALHQRDHAAENTREPALAGVWAFSASPRSAAAVPRDVTCRAGRTSERTGTLAAAADAPGTRSPGARSVGRPQGAVSNHVDPDDATAPSAPVAWRIPLSHGDSCPTSRQATESLANVCVPEAFPLTNGSFLSQTRLWPGEGY